MTASVVLISLLLGSNVCRADPLTLKSRDGQTELRLPDDWSKLDGPNAAAQMTAQNPTEHLFVQVITEGRADITASLQDYAKAARDLVVSKLSDVSVSDWSPLKINGHDAVRCDVKGAIRGFKLAWVMTVVQTDANFHQVLAWTGQSRLESARDQLDALAGDLYEVAPQH